MKKSICLTLFLFTIVLNVVSQNVATIKSFVETTDHISSADKRNDLNGKPCALVKIQVLDEIVRVEGNKIGKIKVKGVEKWVYMCRGSRNMKIHLKNHLPVKVMFQDYKINGLESNRVYELILETSQSDIKQKLTINYTPTNAIVLIDSKIYRGNGQVETMLSLGNHNYTIACDGFLSVEGTIKLNQNAPREITENLTPEETTDNSMSEQMSNQSEDDANKINSVNQSVTPWTKTNYTKSMINGEEAFYYKGLYYTVLSNERKTVAVVKPKSVKYGESIYEIPSQVQRSEETFFVTEIAPMAFYKSANLASVVLPESLEAIGDMAFAYCKNLHKFIFPSNLRFIGEKAFAHDNVSDLILPESIEELAENAFLFCNSSNSQMGRLYIPNTIRSVGKHAFCSSSNGLVFQNAKFEIENLPDWMGPINADYIGIHKDSYSKYVSQKR